MSFSSQRPYITSQQLRTYAGNRDPILMALQLNAFYAGASLDGAIDTNKVIKAFKLFGIVLDGNVATRIIKDIAGPAQRITQESFVNVILSFILQLPSPAPTSSTTVISQPPAPTFQPPAYLPPNAQPVVPPAIQLPYAAPPPPQLPSAIPSHDDEDAKLASAGYLNPSVQASFGPSATTPNPQVAQRVGSFYVTAAAKGQMNAASIVTICQEFGVTCDYATASQLLETIAGPQKTVTQDAFVHHVSLYITRNQH